MMSDQIGRHTHVLDRALTATYRSRSEGRVDIDVTADVMRDVRRLTSEGEPWGPAALLDQLVWRTATITAAVVLIATMLTVGVFQRQAGQTQALLAEELEAVPLIGD
jgi:hypothetical protein